MFSKYRIDCSQNIKIHLKPVGKSACRRREIFVMYGEKNRAKAEFFRKIKNDVKFMPCLSMGLK